MMTTDGYDPSRDRLSSNGTRRAGTPNARNVEQISHGVTNSVFASRDDQTVRKCFSQATWPSYRSMRREILGVSQAARAIGAIAPRVLGKGADWVEYRYISGCPLPEAYDAANRSERRRICSSLAQTLARLHSFSVTDCQGLTLPYTGSTWHNKLVSGYTLLIEATYSLDNDLGRFLETKLELMESLRAAPDDGALLHCDYGGGNLLVDGKAFRLAGVVDWEWSISGPPAFELARIEWLPEVGRSPWLWTNASDRSWFWRTYFSESAARGSTGTTYMSADRAPYRLWLSASHLYTALIARDGITCSRLAEHIARY